MKGRVLCFLALVTASGAQGQGDPTVVARIINEGKNHNQVVSHLRYLTKSIGPRMTGSPQYERAARWCAAKFKEFGLQNVQLFHWGDVPVGFERGKRQLAQMVLPYERKFQFTTMGWTPGTKGATRGPAIIAPASMDEVNQMRSRLRGAWIVAPGTVTMRGPQPGAVPKEVEDALDEAGIAGRIYGSADERIHTHGTFTGLTMDNLPKKVNVVIRKSDMDAVRQALTAGRETILEFDIENRFIKGPMPQFNVIAEIPGTERPDEVVIFGGHLDSWNGPGSEGANDNGTGSMTMLEAARILAKVKARPKRTIRFILFGGEEQGLLGSTAYAKQYESSMGKISGVFVDDGGSNYQGGVAATADMVPMLEKALAPMNAAFPDMPVKVNTMQSFGRGGGSDHASFIPYGVPGFFFMETGRQNYGFVWHTQNDTFENAIPEYLVQSSTNSAVMAYNLACADALLPRVPKPSGGG